jgi:hypothetical protein
MLALIIKTKYQNKSSKQNFQKELSKQIIKTRLSEKYYQN